MPENLKNNLKKKMTLKWKQAEKFSIILGKPKNEVYNNLKLCLKYSKQLRAKIPFYINCVLREGKWSEPYSDSYIKAEQQKRAIEMNAYEKSKEEALNIKKEKINCEAFKEEDPQNGLKLAFWFINKIGSVERAEKLLQAAKLAIEASK